MKKVTRVFGWIPDKPDPRDLKYGAVREMTAKLPPSVDLTPQCSAIEDQSTIGSCTGNGASGMVEFLELKNGVRYVELSRLYAYYNGRLRDGTPGQDCGATIRNVIKGLASDGLCRETVWPYDVSKVCVKPTAASYTEGRKRRILVYERLLTLDELRACLASGYPFMFGYQVFPSTQKGMIAKGGVCPMPGKGERSLGGHCVVGTGYNDGTKLVKCRGSWGDKVGDKGSFYLPYAFVGNAKLAGDFWTIRKGEQV